ncbi:RsmE family RNA methyltransferase [Kiritimatiellaeota bacterium B1221]|nr:RsmE family RNA methyltransferase [Kiritimatiellaeota bacterium B1221]
MNRILYKKTELAHDQLLLTDARATHILQVLKPVVGDRLRTGEIDGPLSEAEVLKLDPQKVILKITDLEMPARPTLDLLLALPRPKVLKRLLPQIAAMGVDHLYLCNAERVEKYYFDTHVLEPGFLHKVLVEGLTQSGDTCLPEVEVVRHLPSFLDKTPFPENRWLLHPGAAESLLNVEMVQGRSVLAIGPEGGWRERELNQFEMLHFQPLSLFDKILRSDTACIAALGLAAAKGEACGRA